MLCLQNIEEKKNVNLLKVNKFLIGDIVLECNCAYQLKSCVAYFLFLFKGLEKQYVSL